MYRELELMYHSNVSVFIVMYRELELMYRELELMYRELKLMYHSNVSVIVVMYRESIKKKEFRVISYTGGIKCNIGVYVRDLCKIAYLILPLFHIS